MGMLGAIWPSWVRGVGYCHRRGGPLPLQCGQTWLGRLALGVVGKVANSGRALGPSTRRAWWALPWGARLVSARPLPVLALEGLSGEIWCGEIGLGLARVGPWGNLASSPAGIWCGGLVVVDVVLWLWASCAPSARSQLCWACTHGCWMQWKGQHQSPLCCTVPRWFALVSSCWPGRCGSGRAWGFGSCSVLAKC